MAVHLVFKGSEKSKTTEHELECFNNQHNEIFIAIKGYSDEFIALDVQTAIKFSKQLRKSISNIKNS